MISRSKYCPKRNGVKRRAFEGCDLSSVNDRGAYFGLLNALSYRLVVMEAFVSDRKSRSRNKNEPKPHARGMLAEVCRMLPVNDMKDEHAAQAFLTKLRKLAPFTRSMQDQDLLDELRTIAEEMPVLTAEAVARTLKRKRKYVEKPWRNLTNPHVKEEPSKSVWAVPTPVGGQPDRPKR